MKLCQLLKLSHAEVSSRRKVVLLAILAAGAPLIVLFMARLIMPNYPTVIYNGALVVAIMIIVGTSVCLLRQAWHTIKIYRALGASTGDLLAISMFYLLEISLIMLIYVIIAMLVIIEILSLVNT